MKQVIFDIVIVGAGPAGLAAASSAAHAHTSIALIDDNPSPGGQIWRGGPTHAHQAWFKRAEASNITRYMQARVVAAYEPGKLIIETPDEALEIGYHKLILATGARERFLPFPGWTLPGVMGAGGLQALVKGGLPIAGKRVVIAGSGPLLLAVASYLKSKGAHVCLLAEQAPLNQLARFALHLPGHIQYLWQAAALGGSLLGIPFKTSCWVTRALGEQRLEAIILSQDTRSLSLDCDYLACGFGLLPNTELASALGCEIQNEAVRVNEWQESSQQAIYCAGEVTGIGGLELSLLEGQIAGLAAIGQAQEARALFPARARTRRFAALQARHFALRPELRALAEPDTIVCRCEDVTYSALEAHTSWRGAKLHTRCGMGPCQGRVCGSATSLLFGWSRDSIRPPIVSARVSSLITTLDTPDKQASKELA
ncbi:NAD(P)/FAD-dependent oxidoreductase [Ktedonospora formicarum]|uniref:Oxidoreductase n=1 Tax=Ktedonospora formicarum TaxID=2778364 RepID=A0A8J3I0G0_9CHLR|nr:FAD/NAD(P)-binding oxidoreductase [Ktedonospora formicarum]GHO42609.1 oxidoreductase [Ktedonospora formicarum]